MIFSNAHKSYLEKTSLASVSIIALVLFFGANVPVFAIATVPGTPTGLAAVAVSPTQVNLFWSAPLSDGGAAISGYKIEYKTGSFYSTLVENTGQATTYSHTSLTTGTTYTYKISALNSIGTSTATADVSITPTSASSATAPGAPTGLAAVATSPTKIDLSWNAPSNNGGYPITGYKIQYRTGSDQYADLVANTASTTTAFSHNGITAGQLYIYRVYAITSFATSEKSSAEVTIQPKSASASTAPGAPTGLAAVATSPTKIDLSWNAPSNNGGYPITGYKIEYKKGTGSYISLVSNTANATTSYSHTGLTTGTTYTYKISAISSIGTGAASTEASTTPTTASTATVPGAPTGLAATAVSATQVNLSWSAPSNGGSAITGYKIEYKSGTGPYSVLVSNTASTSTTYSHTGLTTGTTYTYKISAINSIGTGSASSEASATPTATSQQFTATAPGSPSLSATAVSATQINLSWSTPNDGGSAITGYKIEVKKGTGSFETLVSNTASTSTTYSHTDLTSGTVYYYRVSAINSIGTGTSGDASATPKETTTPTLTAIATSPTQISLSWSAPSQTYQQRINGYKIEEKIGGTSFKTIVENTGLNPYLINGLITGKPHTYVVSAVFGLGASPRSNEASATPLSTSAPPAGYSVTAPPQTAKPSSTNPNAVLKEQQSDFQKKVQQAREELAKKSGKEDSAKAKAARDEAIKANEKARQDALAARQKLMAEKQAQLSAAKNKAPGQANDDPYGKMTPRDTYSKTVNDARIEYEKIANNPAATQKQKADAKTAYVKIKTDAKAALNKALGK
ncbi:fibronectin type III domain-containing protein [Candidatus Nitrosotenuis sp. DW1]|uniref:fibronectin type III domain-containing protein n=1 Tax=Candidatus Nitrosotenuis sp. DW1 TaxID=2259672 RepID=UPI0015CA149B|nr:fibronectin type III domain-containing protein [Candidatus Nitrosotenuis sp. DW1]